MISGCRGGVQAIIQQKLGRAIPHIHCFNRRLHLVVVDCILSVAGLIEYFDYCKTFHNFSPRSKVLALYSETHLYRLMEHRWSGHLKTTLSIVNNYWEVCRLLQSIAHENILRDGEIIVDANGLVCIIQTKLFCCSALLAKSILGIIAPQTNLANT